MAAVNAPLGQLIELIGLVKALQLVDRFGGTSVYVPHESRVKVHGALAEAIGVDAVRTLAGAWPGSHVIVPRGSAYLRRQRDIAILADFKELSAAACARKYETTERHVYRIVERGLEGLPELPCANDTQGDLFGT